MLVVLVTPMHATFPVYLLPLDSITLIIPDLYFVWQMPFVTSHRSAIGRMRYVHTIQQTGRSGTWQLSGTTMGLYHVVLLVTSEIPHKNPEPTSTKTESRHPLAKQWTAQQQAVSVALSIAIASVSVCGRHGIITACYLVTVLEMAAGNSRYASVLASRADDEGEFIHSVTE